MQRAVLLEYLAAAQRHAKESAACIEAQKQMIGALIAIGKDATEAECILQDLEATQTDDLSDMEQILNALEKTLDEDDQS